MTFKEGKPIYVQIADRICDEILSGAYTADQRIPSVREYSVLVEVNVNTTVKAYDHLAQQGVVYNRRGMGYYVAPDAPALTRAERRQAFTGEVLPDVFRQMRLLGIGADELVGHWRQWEAAHPAPPHP